MRVFDPKTERIKVRNQIALDFIGKQGIVNLRVGNAHQFGKNGFQFFYPGQDLIF